MIHEGEEGQLSPPLCFPNSGSTTGHGGASRRADSSLSCTQMEQAAGAKAGLIMITCDLLSEDVSRGEMCAGVRTRFSGVPPCVRVCVCVYVYIYTDIEI